MHDIVSLLSEKPDHIIANPRESVRLAVGKDLCLHLLGLGLREIREAVCFAIERLDELIFLIISDKDLVPTTSLLGGQTEGLEFILESGRLPHPFECLDHLIPIPFEDVVRSRFEELFVESDALLIG